MRAFLVAMALMSCNRDKPSIVDGSVLPDGTSLPDGSLPDDAMQPEDSAQIDAIPDAPLALNCSTYCAEIQAHCTGANTQYDDEPHCIATCESFTVGTSSTTDMEGNTLGCRIYYAGAPSRTDPGEHCAHAGPAGDLMSLSPGVCSGGNICASFCALELKACGSLDAPLAGDPRDGNHNPLFQYQNMANCLSACVALRDTHVYRAPSTGNSLACRLYQATRAVIAVMPDGAMHCSSTAPDPRDPCSGPATP